MPVKITSQERTPLITLQEDGLSSSSLTYEKLDEHLVRLRVKGVLSTFDLRKTLLIALGESLSGEKPQSLKDLLRTSGMRLTAISSLMEAVADPNRRYEDFATLSEHAAELRTIAASLACHVEKMK